MSYERENVARLAAYVPGEQPQRDRVVKLNTNENPYPPCEAVMQAIRSLPAESLRRYPPPTARPFRETAARVHGLTVDHVIATNGGDELLRMALTAFCNPDQGQGGIAVAEPSYSLYPVLANIHDTGVTRIDLDDSFGLTDDFADRAIDAGCRLALIVNPHAPSGRLEPLTKLEAIARRLRGHAVLLIDEAYVDFADHDALPLLSDARGLDNVLLLRTLSKGYSLAGLRFGYGLGHPSLIAALDKVRDSYNTDAVSQAAAVAAITHREEASRTWRAVREERGRLSQALRDRGWTVLPSESNFLLAMPPVKGTRTSGATSGGASDIHESLKQQGIFVRYFDQNRLRDKLRITVGTPEQNDALLAALP